MKARSLPWMEALLGIFILLPSSLILWSLAYQAPLRQTVYVGGDLELQRRHDDEPFLTGMNGSEPADQINDPAKPECQDTPPPTGVQCRLWWWELLERTGGRPYRWTTAEATYLVPAPGRVPTPSACSRADSPAARPVSGRPGPACATS